MAGFEVIFLQHNLARRHAPSAALNRILDLLSPFSYLTRDITYLESIKDDLSSWPELFEYISSLSTDNKIPRLLPVALIQEPNVSEGKITGFPSKLILSRGPCPRAAIVTLSSANISPINQYSSSDCIHAQLSFKKRRMCITSFYHDINVDDFQFFDSQLLQYSNNILAAGDTNAHSTIWGSPSNNGRGDLWEENILSNNFFILNDSDLPTFSNHIGESHIDVTLATMPDRFKLWQNSQIFNGSDHALIVTALSCTNPMVERWVRNIATTNWSTFKANLPTLQKRKINNTRTLEIVSRELVQNISHAFNIACPLKRAFPGTPCKWWNSNLSTLLRKKNLAAKEMRRYKGSQRGIRAYKRKKGLGKLFGKIMKEEKAKSWQAFTSNLNTPKSISSLLKSLKEKKQYDMPLLRRNDGTYAQSHKDNLEILREAHFLGSTTTFLHNKGSNHTRPDLTPELDSFFTMDLLNKAIAELPYGKAPGPDGIKNEVFCHLPREYRAALLEQFKSSLRLSFLPTAWLEIETIYIKKAGKSDYTAPKSFRPIGLSSSILKLCERLINWRIKSTVLKNGIPKQHAFTVNKSTETAISELVHFIEKAKYNNMKAIIVSIDIEGAFDNIPFEMIRESLLHHGADPLVVNWIDYLSKNRSVFSTLGGVKAFFRPQKGTTQGGLNGPDLWIIFLWSIIFLAAARATNISKYADDLISALMGKDLTVIRDIIQSALDQFIDWFNSRGLKVSPQKTFCMIVGKNKREPFPKPLTIGGTQIPFVKQMKYLGVTIDSDLSWRPHILDKISKAKRDLMMAKRIVSKSWGLSPDKMMWVYEGIVRPSLDYACQIWTPVNSPPQWLSKALDKVQRLALMSIIQPQKSTPTRALERLANLPPLYLHLKEKAASTIARIFNSVDKANWDGIGSENKRSHLFKWNKFLGPNLKPIKQSYLLNLGTFKVHWDLPQQPATPGWNIYTDGSKLNQKTGLGWAITHGDSLVSRGNRSLPDYCSVFEAEMSAIPLAISDFLNRLDPLKPKPSVVSIFVDNQSTLHSINKTKLVGDLRVGLVKSLHNLIESHNITPVFYWVKSHNDNVGNDLADYEAKLGTATSYQMSNPPQPSMTFIKGCIRAKLRKEWDAAWSNLTDCRQSKKFITFSPNRGDRKYLLSRSRLRCKKLVALLTGHNNLRYHTFKRQVNNNPNFSPCCRFCVTDVESSWHLMYDCPSLDRKRRELLYGPDYPKKGPDIKEYEAWADHLGILDIILVPSE